MSKRSEQWSQNQPNTVIDKMLKLDVETRGRIMMDFDISKRELTFHEAGKLLSKRFMKYH